jgi:hypothetical protein
MRSSPKKQWFLYPHSLFHFDYRSEEFFLQGLVSVFIDLKFLASFRLFVE